MTDERYVTQIAAQQLLQPGFTPASNQCHVGEGKPIPIGLNGKALFASSVDSL